MKSHLKYEILGIAIEKVAIHRCGIRLSCWEKEMRQGAKTRIVLIPIV